MTATDSISDRVRSLDRWFPWAYAAAYVVVLFAVYLRGDPTGDLDLDTDFYGDLLLAAKKLARGELSVLDYPYKGPVYPLVLAAMHALVGDWYRGAVVLNVLAAGGVLVVTFRLWARFLGPVAAGATIVLLSLVVDFFVHAHHATTDILFLFLATLSILLLVRVWDGRAGARVGALLLGSGALAAAAFLTRYNGAFLPLAACIALVAIDPSRSPWRERWRRAGLHVAGFALVCAPWVTLNLQETGRLLPVRNVQNVTAGVFGDPRWSTTEIASPGDLVDAVAVDPATAAARIVRNWWSHFKADMNVLLGWPGAAIALVGLAGAVVAPPSRAVWAVLCFPLLYAVLMGPLFYSTRFFYFLVPAYYGLGAAFLLGARTRARPRFAVLEHVGVRRALVVGAAALLLVQGLRIQAAEHLYFANRPLYLLPAAEALRVHAGAHGHSVVMARKGHLAHLAGLAYQPYPLAAARRLDTLLQFAREHDVDYVVYGVPEAALCPDLRFLGQMESVPGLSSVYVAPQIRIFACSDDAASAKQLASHELEMLRANLAAAERVGAADQIVMMHGDLADYYQKQGDWELARREVQTTIDLSDRAAGAGNEVMRRNAAVARYRMAKIWLLEGRPDVALPLSEDFLARMQTIAVPRDLARAHLFVAQCYAALHRVAEAEAQLAKARSLDPTLKETLRKTQP